jgi:hypothetical protein
LDNSEKELTKVFKNPVKIFEDDDELGSSINIQIARNQTRDESSILSEIQGDFKETQIYEQGS